MPSLKSILSRDITLDGLLWYKTTYNFTDSPLLPLHYYVGPAPYHQKGILLFNKQTRQFREVSTNPSVPPLSPPLKSGSTIPVHPHTIIPNPIAHKAIDTNATETTNSVSISDEYKIIPGLKQFEGHQRYPCFNCKSDVPSRHYYL